MGRRRHSEPGGPFRDGTGPEAPTRVTRHTLSRREALAVLGTIGITTAGAELGTSAYFSDRETCENNRLVADELDLKAAYSAHYSHWSADEDGSTTGIGDDVSVRMYGGPAGTTGDAGNAGLVGDVPAERGGGRGRNCFSAGTTHSAALARWVPVDHGNERQSDSATFSLGRSAEQCRHSEAAGTESAASPEGRELDARSGPTDVGGSDDESQYGSAVDVGDGVSAVGAPGDDGGRGQAVEFARRDPEDGDSDRGIRAAPDGYASTPRAGTAPMGAPVNGVAAGRDGHPVDRPADPVAGGRVTVRVDRTPGSGPAHGTVIAAAVPSGSGRADRRDVSADKKEIRHIVMSERYE